MNNVRLMPDYGCFPLWNPGGRPYALDEGSLPLSQALISELWAWAEEYNKTLNQADPLSSGFATPELEDDFVRRGASLARSIYGELGGRTTVEYKYISDRVERQEIIG